MIILSDAVVDWTICELVDLSQNIWSMVKVGWSFEFRSRLEPRAKSKSKSNFSLNSKILKMSNVLSHLIMNDSMPSNSIIYAACTRASTDAYYACCCNCNWMDVCELYVSSFYNIFHSLMTIMFRAYTLRLWLYCWSMHDSASNGVCLACPWWGQVMMVMIWYLWCNCFVRGWIIYSVTDYDYDYDLVWVDNEYRCRIYARIYLCLSCMLLDL
jgi:hypothetical protein